LPLGALSHGVQAALRALPPLHVVPRETGTAFALNAMIEADRVALPEGVPAVPEFYRIAERRPKESLERRAALTAARH
jgi:hypothetical protein